MASISENWNCADSGSLTCQLTWTQFDGLNFELFTNAAAVRGSVHSGSPEVARADSDLASANHYAQATLVTWTNSSLPAAGVVVRKDSSATKTYYMARAVGGGAPEYRIEKVVAGTESILQTYAQDPVVNDVIKLEVQDEGGNARLTLSVNGTPFAPTVLDASSPITGNTRCGVAGYANAAGDAIALDTWSAADLAGAEPRVAFAL